MNEYIWIDYIAAALMLLGALFTLLTAIGLIRMPDVYCRISAASKATPFGIGLLLLGLALSVREPFFSLQAVLIAVFVTLTMPVAAHALARAGYRSGALPWEGTQVDDLAGHDLVPSPTMPRREDRP